MESGVIDATHFLTSCFKRSLTAVVELDLSRLHSIASIFWVFEPSVGSAVHLLTHRLVCWREKLQSVCCFSFVGRMAGVGGSDTPWLKGCPVSCCCLPVNPTNDPARGVGLSLAGWGGVGGAPFLPLLHTLQCCCGFSSFLGKSDGGFLLLFLSLSIHPSILRRRVECFDWLLRVLALCGATAAPWTGVSAAYRRRLAPLSPALGFLHPLYCRPASGDIFHLASDLGPSSLSLEPLFFSLCHTHTHLAGLLDDRQDKAAHFIFTDIPHYPSESSTAN